ncbi:hypothetical protein ACMDB9_12590, partial [Faecalibacterium wellingii]
MLKLAAQVEDFPPVTDRIALANGTLYLDGTFQEGKLEIVRNRLPVKYDPKAPQPSHWLRFLSNLLYPEDIPTVQEFIGYCRKKFLKWQDAHPEFPRIVFHGLQHSSATYQLMISGGDVKAVQGTTGHATADMLVNTYAHIQQSSRVELGR